MSCMGCHQSRSIAGFHFVGVEPGNATSKDVDVVVVAMSPHLHDELERRAHYLQSLAAGGKTDERRPLPERGAHAGDYGSHCGLGAAFAAWTCDPGLRCVALDEADVGVCLAETSEVGDPCEPGRVSSSADAHRDCVTLTAVRACPGEQVCEATSVGFPGGMCAARCGEGGPQAACGAIALLTPFNNCIARGRALRGVRARQRPDPPISVAARLHPPLPRRLHLCPRGPGPRDLHPALLPVPDARRRPPARGLSSPHVAAANEPALTSPARLYLAMMTPLGDALLSVESEAGVARVGVGEQLLPGADRGRGRS